MNYLNNYVNSNTATGHFTQIIWAEVTHLGCARAEWNGRQELVCNYGPVGNIRNQPIYLSGPQCSKCPKGCSTMYKGLCK